MHTYTFSHTSNVHSHSIWSSDFPPCFPTNAVHASSHTLELFLTFHRATFLCCYPQYRLSWASQVAQLVKNPPANARNLGLIPGPGRAPGGGNGNPLQYSCLGNPMDRGTWRVTLHGVAKESDLTYQLNNIHFSEHTCTCMHCHTSAHSFSHVHSH